MSEEPKIETATPPVSQEEEHKENIVIEIFKKLLEINYQRYGVKKDF